MCVCVCVCVCMYANYLTGSEFCCAFPEFVFIYLIAFMEQYKRKTDCLSVLSLMHVALFFPNSTGNSSSHNSVSKLDLR